MKKKKQIFVLAIFILAGVLLFEAGFVTSQGGYQYSPQQFSGSQRQVASFVNYGGPSSYQTYFQGGRLTEYFPIYDNLNDPNSCQARQDISIQITPLGCEPAVVRSDLLAEQNVPVFCQLDALKLNPLIDVEQIRDIRFSGPLPEYVAGVGFYPARAALRTQDRLLGSPLLNNIGYVVVVLKQNEIEDELPELVEFTLNAQIDYYSGGSIGAGGHTFYLQETLERDLDQGIGRQTFFQGRYSIGLLEADSQEAKVKLYYGDQPQQKITVRKSGTNDEIYLPGSYCQVGLRLNYEKFESADKIAKLYVDGDEIAVTEGARFLNNKCTVRKIEGEGNIGYVNISCGREEFSLKLSPRFLQPGDIVVLMGDEDAIQHYISEINEETGEYTIVSFEDETERTVKPEQIIVVDSGILFETTYDDIENLDDYFEKAVSDYKKVAKDYTDLRSPESEASNLDVDSYGEVALEKAILLSGSLKKEQTQFELIDEFLRIYSLSDKVDYYEKMRSELHQKDNSLGAIVVDIENKLQEIRLLEIESPNLISTAGFNWAGETFTLKENEHFINDKGDNITLNEVLDDDRVKITSRCDGEKSRSETKIIRIDSQETDVICEYTLSLTFIDLQKFARIRIEPNVRTNGETEFTVGVGIEKRAIELSPEKAAQKIENLEETIDKWSSISENLNNINTGLQAACLATGALLTVKNFFTGLDGEALARQHVMRGEDGWTEWCSQQVAQGEYESLTNCYSENNDKISIDVQTYQTQISSTNVDINNIEDNCRLPSSNDPLFGGGALDLDECKPEMKAKLLQECGSEKIKLSDGTEKFVSDLLPEDDKHLNYHQMRDMYLHCKARQSGDLSIEVGRKRADENLQVIGDNFNRNKDYLNRLSISDAITDKLGIPATDTRSVYTGRRLSAFVSNVDDEDAQDLFNLGEGEITNKKAALLPMGDIPQRVDGDKIIVKDFKGGNFAVLLEPIKGRSGEYKIVDVRTVDPNGGEIQNVDLNSGIEEGDSEEQIAEQRKRNFQNAYQITEIQSQDSLDYVNQFLPEDAKVRYYETEPFAGTPAIVPFDFNEGWYVATRPKLQGIGGQKVQAIEASGRPVSFWVCNVMKDREIDFFTPGFDDDKCARFDFDTGQAVDIFPGLFPDPESSQAREYTRNLVTCAKEALRQAQEQHGNAAVTINCAGRGQQTFEKGDSAGYVPGTQCQDFMSPDECLLLFNVCDPVICPSSRCDFGGSYHVDNVVQSGIVGSVLLCLPNINDPVIIPVCLTGIKAGLDSYISILQQHQACLQDNIDTGRTVGICDLVTSVYTCEFFWRQAAPIADTLIPKAVEYLAYGGQGDVVGGGEYLTVNAAWQNAQDSVDYFTEYYAENAFDAFQVRSYDEAGTTFCRAFVSAKGPDVFETLIEPQSPPQFVAWFSEIPQTDAIPGGSSQYKVFYHIYAGNDIGVSYSVRLINGPASDSFGQVPVSFDFVPRGQSVSETKDFTAPSGYKELCVSINGEEQCGFKQVSTNFALNLVRDEFVQDQITQSDITTEEECISGKVNTLALLNPNIQEAFQEAIDPAIYKRGITRVCATGKPEETTAGERFVNVGYCGHPNVICWLDVSSIDKALTTDNIGARQETIAEIEKIKQELLIDNEEVGFYKESDYKDEFDKLKADIEKNPLDVISKLKLINDAMQKAFWDYQNAELMTLRGTVYDNAAIELKGSGLSGIDEEGNDEDITPEVIEEIGYKFKIPEGENDLMLHLDGIIVDPNVKYGISTSNPNNGALFLENNKRIADVLDNKINLNERNYQDISSVVLEEILSEIDGGKINPDDDYKISTCKVEFRKKNGEESLSEELNGQDFQFNDILLLRINNCGLNSIVNLTFSYVSGSDPYSQLYYAYEFDNNGELVIEGEVGGSNGPFEWALGEFTAKVINYGIIIDTENLPTSCDPEDENCFYIP